MTCRRTALRAIVATLLVASPTARAQSPAPRTYRIGFLGAESVTYGDQGLTILRETLRELGYVEGRNLAFEVRYADGRYERLPELAGELVRLKVDVLVASGSKAGIAAKGATITIPVVVDNMGDAVRAGFAPSYGQPGGNVTGASAMNPEVTTKQLELLHELKPRVSVVAALMNPANPNYELTQHDLRRQAERLGVRLVVFDVRSRDELPTRLAEVGKARIEAMVVQSETLFATSARELAELALRHRIAGVGRIDYARAGGLLGYSVDRREIWRHVAGYVDRILKGAKPGELPIAQPTKIILVINLKTARALGITVPQSMLLRADEVIQ